MHDRKLKSGYLKEIGTQTSFSEMRDLLFRTSVSKNQQESAIPFPYSMKYNSAGKLPVRSDTKSRKTCSWPIITYNPTSSENQSGGMHLPSFEKFLVDPQLSSTTFNDLGGMDKLKQIILEYVIKPFISGNEVDTPRGILLIGDKGTGKSCIAQAIVNQLRVMMFQKEVKFYSVDGSNCFGTCIGPGINFHDLLHNTLENDPTSVILFENIDQLYNKSIPTLLSDLSSIPRGRLLLIGTTRKRRTLNQQFLQIREHGQFDHIFEIELPDFWERVSILKLHFQTHRLPIDDQNILELANLTISFNAGDLAKLVAVINVKALERYRRLKEKYKGMKSEGSMSSGKPEAQEIAQKKVFSAVEMYKRNGNIRDPMKKQSLSLHPTESSRQKQTMSMTNISSGSTIDHFIYDSDSDNLLTKVTQWVTQKYDEEE